MRKTPKTPSRTRQAINKAQKVLTSIKNRCHYNDGTPKEYFNPSEVETIYLDSIAALVELERLTLNDKVYLKLV